jgi:hypothetical protein
MSVSAVRGNWDDFHHRALERVSTLETVAEVLGKHVTLEVECIDRIYLNAQHP